MTRRCHHRNARPADELRHLITDRPEHGARLAGRHVLITAGPTHEPIDPVRYIANRSSGKQGHAIAAATGTLVDRPSRLLVIARGWRRDHVLTREIQAVFDVNGAELRLVRWREQDR